MVIWFLVFLVVSPAAAVDADPPTYEIDLDQPPEVRWKHAVIPHISALQTINKEMMTELSPTQIHIFASFLRKTFLDKDILAEITSTAEWAGLSVDKIIVLSFFYELNAYCTSLVVRGKDGKLIHGRNLDYPVPATMRSLVANVNFTRSGVLLYRATTFIGYFGILTAVKPGAFSVSLDQRNAHTSVIWNIISAARGTLGNTIAIRRVMETVSTYEEAIQYLSTAQLVTESYYILSGPGKDDAAVISRLRSSSADIWRLQASDWYIVETNYDHWKPDPEVDPRKTHAVKHLDKLGKGNVGEEEIWKVLSTRPVFQDRTIYTTLMSVAKGSITSTIRNVKPREEFY